MAPNLHVFLKGYSYHLTGPNFEQALILVTSVSILLLSTLYVRIRRGPLTSSMGNFKNSLKNINVILSLVWLFTVISNFLLDILAKYEIPLTKLLLSTAEAGR